jgi:hypothetical protein
MHPLLPLLLLVAASTASAASNGGLAEAVVGLMRGCASPNGASGGAEALDCLQGRALDTLGHSLANVLDGWRLKDVELSENVVLVAGDEEASRSPRTFFKGGASANDILAMVANFLQSRTLQVRFPKEIIPNNLDEGEFY